ncbi:MAG TPA: ribose-phosphate pyrophosphokinase [Candidatus Omnitrophota bacterium]|nr:ribose-phosphate pyrophosphokinase [Candidatus Omnitrophota bacterium]
MADPKSKSWEFARKIHDYIKNEKGIDIPLRMVDIRYFNNNEIDMHVPQNVRKRDIYFIHDSTKSPQDWWVQLLLLKDLLLSASANSVTFVLPDMLYSRKDRKDKPHVPISARAFADSISPGLRRVITVDLHAAQVQGFYPAHVPLDNLYSFPVIVRFLKENKILGNPEELVVLSPDVGGVERARNFANRLGSRYSIAFMYKRRDKPGEVGEMILVGEVTGKDVLIVDDIIDSGGTLCKASELLKKNGAKNIYCYGTHGLFTKGLDELQKHFAIIMTSNTNYRDKDGLVVVDLAPLFAEAVYRAQMGQSISELFDNGNEGKN